MSVCAARTTKSQRFVLTLGARGRIVLAMAFVRLFFAIVIAVSVALAPASGSPTLSVGAPAMATADHKDMPCCPSSDDAKASIACAFKCLSFVAIAFSADGSLVYVANGLPETSSDSALCDHVSPPRHPPPI